jgi:hypothetical protein
MRLIARLFSLISLAISEVSLQRGTASRIQSGILAGLGIPRLISGKGEFILKASPMAETMSGLVPSAVDLTWLPLSNDIDRSHA